MSNFCFLCKSFLGFWKKALRCISGELKGKNKWEFSIFLFDSVSSWTICCRNSYNDEFIDKILTIIKIQKHLKYWNRIMLLSKYSTWLVLILHEKRTNQNNEEKRSNNDSEYSNAYFVTRDSWEMSKDYFCNFLRKVASPTAT